MSFVQREISREFPSLSPLGDALPGDALPFDCPEGPPTTSLHRRTARPAVPRQLYNAQPEPKKVFRFDFCCRLVLSMVK
jgi:hypothetical protein